MYTSVAEMSRAKASNNRLSPSWFRVPGTKLRNVVCVLCRSKFYVPDLSNLNGLILKGTLIPLLLECGHPICNKCNQRERLKTCPSCKTDLDNGFKRLLPLNLYTLGLIVSSYHRPLENDDEEFRFCHKLSSQLRQIAKQGCCHECGNQANVNCPQCMVLYCYCCYSKIHGRALQNHIQIPIHDGGPGSPADMLNSCSPTCSEMLGYFCNDCSVACCSNCTLLLHKLHNFVALSEKNQTLLPEFNETYMHIEETLLRVCQTKEKIKSAITSNTYKVQNSEIIEASVAQHFAYLHGVLQNMEARLMNQLHEQSDCLKNNLEDIERQLGIQEEKLKMTLQIASYAKQTFHKMDIRNAINILNEMADLPCHLMYKDACQNQIATFTVDDSIAAAIEDHCAIAVPLMSSYNLVRKDELPKNYIMSPLSKKLRAMVFDEPPSMLPEMQPSKALVALPPTTIIDNKTEDSEQEESISEYKVEVTYVVNPSFFFVRKLATKPEFLQLEKDITAYGNGQKNLVETPINIEQDEMCIVKQWKADEWYRGRVTAASTTADGERVYNAIYIDYGYEECNIAASRVREIAKHLRELPPQAIRCSLHGLLPKNLHWTNASTNDFLKLTNGADCTMSVFNSTRDVQYVDICFISKNSNMGPQSMCSTMKIMDYARLNTRLSPKHELKATTTYVYTKEDLLLSKMTTVNIGWIESPEKIYVLKAMRQNKFLKIRNEMNEYFEKDTSPNIIETPQEGLPCAVQLEDNTWQRGEITEIINENQVRVFCVDWGYTLIQNCDTLRAIPHEYTIFKAQAIKVALMYIMAESDGSWKPEALSSLLHIFNNANCITINPRRKLDDGYIGCMYADDIDISRQLKVAGVVNEFFFSKFKNKPKKLRLAIKPTIPLESDNNPKSDNTIKDLCVSWNDTQVEDDDTVKDETPKDPFKVEVHVQRVTTPDCIYVAQTEYEKSNAKLMAAMQKFYDAYFSEPRDNWSEGALCAVYSAKDKSYFRAKILKIKSSTEVLVYFYDMGIEETVTMKDIQVLLSKFAKEMTYCFKVKLAGILPCGGSSTWPKLSCATLSEIIRENANCKFYITKPVQEEICDDVVSVELWVRQLKVPGPLARTEVEINSINRMLVEKGVALPIKNYFAKADSTLATEFRQQLESSCWFVQSIEEEEVKWLNKGLNETEMDETLISPKDELSFCNSSIDVLTTLALKYQACESTDRECAVKFSDWLPPTEITEEVFHAIPTNVGNKCVVYLHSKKYNADVVHYIETELQTHYKNIKINKDKQWKEGELCIARYHGNQKWYRGKIIKTSGNIVQVEFVDYGNVEDCEMEHVTDHVRLGHIPIQCTKCVISGLKPASPTGKWIRHDLDRIHALLVDKECKVSILQRQPTYLIISIQLLQPWKCDFLMYLANHMEKMNVKIERKEWNDSDNSEDEEDDLKSLDTTRDVVIEETVSEYEKLSVADISNGSSGTYTQDVTLIEDMISGNLAESLKTELLDKLKIKISDTESISSIETNILNNHLICSTPQPQSEEEDGVFLSYKQLTIPQETKYIEIKLCCNKDPITSFAQLAENNDHMFSNELHKYYLRYEIIMSELQTDARHQPLLESFAKNTPCITKFIDDMWYRCVITNSEKIPNSQYIKISLYYVDYGNHEYRILDLLSEDHNLYAPKQKWLEVPAMAIKCTFWGLNFVSDDIDLLASKLDEIYNQAVVAQIKEINNGNNLVVQIYKDKTCRELFYAHLIEEGLYQFKKPKED
ncbi:RING finger protein 17 isoform X2 [Temnothorax nylanderi]